LFSGENLASTIAKANTISFSLTMPRDDDCIAISKELALLATRQGHGLCSFPAQLNHRAKGIRSLCSLNRAQMKKGNKLIVISWPVNWNRVRIPEGITYRTADGSRTQQIAGAHIATCHSMVHQLLLHRPIQVLCIRPFICGFRERKRWF